MTSPSWNSLTERLLCREDLTAEDTAWVMRQVITDRAPEASLAGFLIALRAKGESAEEIAGLADALLADASPLLLDLDTVDVVGTGGDQAHTVNISTMAAITVAGAGIPVAKHGGRSVSSKSGSADVLEALGIPLDLPPEAVLRCVTEAGIGYLFAPRFHTGLKYAAPVRRSLGVPTAFNYVAPLVNPARPRAGCVGCANPRLAPVLAQVLAQRGCSALVVRGEDGLDEISTAAPTRIWTVSRKEVREQLLDTTDLGLPRSQPGDLRGGDATFNAAAIHRFLDGERGPVRDAVLINAAAAIAAHRGLDGDLHRLLAHGLTEAAQAVDSGAAKATLERWVTTAASARNTGD
ncbi:anthranilate phosphoribosyltransferase [Streptomyces sp. NPDC021100]|uniref:anthranilate phosphoribosyltransferase n=1 Tax=Streptomyces sp. NPDC021100 TaxID=3365114 RepID=UPI0037A52CC8